MTKIIQLYLITHKNNNYIIKTNTKLPHRLQEQIVYICIFPVVKKS